MGVNIVVNPTKEAGPHFKETQGNPTGINDFVSTLKEDGTPAVSKTQYLANAIQKYQPSIYGKLCRTDLYTHDIYLTSKIVLGRMPYCVPQHQEQMITHNIFSILDKSVFDSGKRDYASRFILVKFPGIEPRPCVD